jgi:hypothetical protein
MSSQLSSTAASRNSLNYFSIITTAESESYVTTDGQPASLSWNKAPIWGLRPDLHFLCDSYGLVLVCRPLWREVGSVFCMCCWPLPAQSFSGPSPLGLETYILLSQIWDFPFRRLLRFAGSRWRYSTPPPHGSTPQLVWGPRYISSGRTQEKTSFPNNSFIVAFVFVSTGTCLPSRCLEISIYSGSTIPAFRPHITIH